MEVAGQAGKGDEKVASRFSSGLPLMQCVLVKTASGATGNVSELKCSSFAPCMSRAKTKMHRVSTFLRVYAKKKN